MKKVLIGILTGVLLEPPAVSEVSAAPESPAALESSAAPEPPVLNAASAVLMDADSGRVLFEKDGFTVRSMASTTKIMTCILALEEGNLTDVVNVSENAARQPKVHLGMQMDEKFYLRDLLYSLMLESHNDSAVAIAEHIGGSVQAFADKMNVKAKEIGCRDTYFITPNGLDASDDNGEHSTTAEDLARIMSYCILKSPKKESFLSITQKGSYHFMDVDCHRSFSCQNHNAFLTMMDGALSGKTGFTGKAGYCYVGALESRGRTFVVALLGCGWPNNKGYKWADTKRLMTYGMENYELREAFSGKEPLRDVTVKAGIPTSGNLFEKAHVPVKIEKIQNSPVEVLLHREEEIETVVELQEEVQAPIERYEKLGTVRYILDGEVLQQYPIVAQENVEKINFRWIFQKISGYYFLNEDGRM